METIFQIISNFTFLIHIFNLSKSVDL